jgi:hypothetical protein
MNMQFGDNFGIETLENEYKEFTFNHSGLEIDEDEAENLIKSSIWCFNDMIIESLKKYFKIYVAKYASAFLNEESESSAGHFYIGINDDGTISGIPFQGEIDINFIKFEIKKVINKYIYSDDIESIHKSISVELLNVNYTPFKIKRYTPIYERYLLQKTKLKAKKQQFKLDMKKWNHIHDRYAQKLVDLFNNSSTRNELMNYIGKQDPKNNVIDIIKTDYVLDVKKHDEINELKNNPTEPYYWVCKFKDEHLEIIRKARPIPNFKKKISTYIKPIAILLKISNMIPWWMQNNKDMKLFIIKINFIKNKDNKDVYYLDNFSKLIKCIRTKYEEKPYCRPI